MKRLCFRYAQLLAAAVVAAAAATAVVIVVAAASPCRRINRCCYTYVLPPIFILISDRVFVRYTLYYAGGGEW